MLVYLFFIFTCGWCVCWLLFLNYQQYTKDSELEERLKRRKRFRRLKLRGLNVVETTTNTMKECLVSSDSKSINRDMMSSVKSSRPIQQFQQSQFQFETKQEQQVAGDTANGKSSSKLAVVSRLGQKLVHSAEPGDFELHCDNRENMINLDVDDFNFDCADDDCDFEDGEDSAGSDQLDEDERELVDYLGEEFPSLSGHGSSSSGCQRCAGCHEQRIEMRGWPEELIELAEPGEDEDEVEQAAWPVAKLYENPLSLVVASTGSEPCGSQELLDRSRLLSLQEQQQENRAAIRMVSWLVSYLVNRSIS